MSKPNIGVRSRSSATAGDGAGQTGENLIALAQQLARDAERHALLSASLASQAERLMLAGIRQLERRTGPRSAH
jgi:hypothetical protein